jgi:hypothetical protein
MGISEMQDMELDDVRAHAATYLFGAGWEPAPLEVPGALAMRHGGACASFAIRVDPAAGRIDLRVSLAGCGAMGGVFRGGAAELRVFARGPDLLGFLCFLTSSQGDLDAHTTGEWLDSLVRVCPETYAVISLPGVPEALARVALADEPHVLH